MPQSPSDQAVLDCSDSPLSVAGNVIGVLTLAYAVLITVIYRTRTLVKAKDESKKFYKRAERAHSALIESKRRLDIYFSTVDLQMSQEIELLFKDFNYWDYQYKKGLQTKPGYHRTHEEEEADNHRRAMRQKGLFLLQREDMTTVVEGMLQTRATLDGTYQVLLNRCVLSLNVVRNDSRLILLTASMIIDEIREQRAGLETQSRAISKQTTMLTEIIGAFNLVPPSDEMQVFESTGRGIASKSSPVDMLEMYLRPFGALGEVRQSERHRATRLEYGPPPSCEHDHSHKKDHGRKPLICSESYGKAYFDLEKALWLRPSSPGTQVYFDAEKGKWMKSTFEPVDSNV